jgi:hypothetical protein
MERGNTLNAELDFGTYNCVYPRKQFYPTTGRANTLLKKWETTNYVRVQDYINILPAGRK